VKSRIYFTAAAAIGCGVHLADWWMELLAPAGHFRPPAVGRYNFVERGYRVFAAVRKRVSLTGAHKRFSATVPQVPFSPSEKEMVLSGRTLSQNLLDYVLGRSEPLRQSSDARLIALSRLPDLFDCQRREFLLLRSANPSSSAARFGHSSNYSFPNQFTLKFRHTCHHMEQQSPGARGGVHTVLLQRHEVDLQSSKFLQALD
jgi:hypothetical protein